MTDVYVENVLKERFKQIGEPFIKYDEQNKITNISFPNESFVRPSDGQWMEFWFVPPEPFQKELFREARNRYVGLVQINIVVPTDSGTEAVDARYEIIAKNFRRGDIYEGVRIAKTYRTPAAIDGDFYIMPVTIVWEADLDN